MNLLLKYLKRKTLLHDKWKTMLSNALCPSILDAWNYSCSTGVQPLSHKESIIVILPKEGKDIKDIKNWRPIILSNCDAKIITKLTLSPLLTISPQHQNKHH